MRHMILGRVEELDRIKAHDKPRSDDRLPVNAENNAELADNVGNGSS